MTELLVALHSLFLLLGVEHCILCAGEGSMGQGAAGRGEVDVMGPPMLVTYRLQGLDGEATERMIEHLAEPAAEQQEPEQEYAVARVLAEQGSAGWPLSCCLERHLSAA